MSVPMYVPSMAVFGVLKPSPTSLNHLRPPFPAFVLFALFVLVLTKMCGCFWKARSDCTVNSVAIVAECRAGYTCEIEKSSGFELRVWEAEDPVLAYPSYRSIP